MFNQSITVYNKYFDTSTRLDAYQRTIINGVHWDETNAVNRLSSGLQDADKAMVVIPFRADATRVFLTPDKFESEENKEGYFTLQPNDRIVKGALDFEIEGKVSSLDKFYDAHVILSVDTKDFGSPRMQHWEVGAK